MSDAVEEWRSIPEFPHYEVSNMGRVRRYGSAITAAVFKNPRDRRPWVRVTLYKDRVPTQRAVHVLVANAFLGERPKGTSVQFKNGDSTDARLENLYYGRANYDMYIATSKRGRIK
ncbi:HNH endonuclease [Amycolatopsis nalaikhensis]|uniref:HNH endonuclease n=1 Tax=Amycolatopsis nalaikhensis TaxID=715472 RepID=UPI0033201C8F